MYPLCLMLPGMLHVLYNALHEAILSIPSSSEFLEHLWIIESFFCNKELRSAFQHQCLRSYEKRKLFDACSTVHIDWTWEFLSRALDKLVPLLSLFALRCTIESMTASDSSLLKTSLTTTVAAIFAAEPFFAVWAELYRTLGHRVEHYAKQLETCWCHESVWNSKKSFPAKRKHFMSLTGFSRCVWKGKMAPWWVAVGIKELLSELCRCTSERLDPMISQLPTLNAGTVLRELQLMRSRIVEALREKLAFFFSIPYKAIGGFWCDCGGCLKLSKTIIKECMVEYDDAVSLGRPLHRIAHRLFRKRQLVQA